MGDRLGSHSFSIRKKRNGLLLFYLVMNVHNISEILVKHRQKNKVIFACD